MRHKYSRIDHGVNMGVPAQIAPLSRLPITGRGTYPRSWTGVDHDRGYRVATCIPRRSNVIMPMVSGAVVVAPSERATDSRRSARFP
jgi:hypothetical protein